MKGKNKFFFHHFFLAFSFPPCISARPFFLFFFPSTTHIFNLVIVTIEQYIFSVPFLTTRFVISPSLLFIFFFALSFLFFFLPSMHSCYAARRMRPVYRFTRSFSTLSLAIHCDCCAFCDHKCILPFVAFSFFSLCLAFFSSFYSLTYSLDTSPLQQLIHDTGIVYHLSKDELDKYDAEHERELEQQRRSKFHSFPSSSSSLYTCFLSLLFFPLCVPANLFDVYIVSTVSPPSPSLHLLFLSLTVSMCVPLCNSI